MLTDEFEKDEDVSSSEHLNEDTPSTGPTIPDTPAQMDEDDFEIEINQKKVNFETQRSVSSVVDDKEETFISFILENPDTFHKVMDKYSKVLDQIVNNETTTGASDKNWVAAIFSGIQHSNLEPTPIGATEREESIWLQGVKKVDDDSLIRAGRPAQKIDRTKRQSKEELLAYLTKKSGNGSVYETFLPHSGVWLRLRSPSLAELLAVQSEMQQIKLQIGSQSKGMSYSNSGALLFDAITTLALNCVIASNKKYMTPTDIEFELSIFDEVILHHALASTMYPDGFNYNVPCVMNPKECSHVIKERINMSSIIWMDNTQFNDTQRKFIAKRFTQATDEEFKTYREGFNTNGKRVFWFGDIGLRLAIPTIAQRRESARQWIDMVIQMSQGAFNEPPHGSNRSKYIDKLSHATTAMQYAHWIDAIYERDEEVSNEEDQLLTDDSEVITEYLTSTLSTPEYADKFFDTVHKYTNDSVIAIVALPSHNCPECKKKQGESNNERFPHLVPLDMVSTFFTLAGRKVAHLE